MSCTGQFLTNFEARDILGYFMISLITVSLVLTLGQISWIVITDVYNICKAGKIDERKKSVAQKRILQRQKRATHERLIKLRELEEAADMKGAKRNKQKSSP